MSLEIIIISAVLVAAFAVAIVILRQSYASGRRLAEREADIHRVNAEALRAENESLKHSELNLTRRLAESETQRSALEERIANHKAELEETQKRFRSEFENLANEILERKTQKFTELNKENIGSLLKPLGENIEDFRKRVNEIYSAEGKDRASLGQQIRMLMELNARTREEAHNLAEALKGNSKVQGDWGEMILERILESSGLTEGREFTIQEVIRDEDGAVSKADGGRTMRPDVIIYYPDNRKIVVDSKVSLKAYTDWANASDEAEREKFLGEHVASVKRHADDLSSKRYQDYIDSLDFVMMFIPNESAFMAALGGDNSMWDYAYAKRVIIISPTNLILSLKIISDLWKRDDQNKNAQKIATQGAAMYDKIAMFAETFAAVGSSIDKSRQAYEKAVGQLSEGRGNLLRRAEEMRKLGLKTSKTIAVQSDETEESDDTED